MDVGGSNPSSPSFKSLFGNALRQRKIGVKHCQRSGVNSGVKREPEVSKPLGEK